MCVVHDCTSWIINDTLSFVTGSSSSNPSPPPERPAVEATAVDAYRVDLDIPVRTAISKRKVASAPAAPAYKGNMVPD